MAVDVSTHAGLFWLRCASKFIEVCLAGPSAFSDVRLVAEVVKGKRAVDACERRVHHENSACGHVVAADVRRGVPIVVLGPQPPAPIISVRSIAINFAQCKTPECKTGEVYYRDRALSH